MWCNGCKKTQEEKDTEKLWKNDQGEKVQSTR